MKLTKAKRLLAAVFTAVTLLASGCGNTIDQNEQFKPNETQESAVQTEETPAEGAQTTAPAEGGVQTEVQSVTTTAPADSGEKKDETTTTKEDKKDETTTTEEALTPKPQRSGSATVHLLCAGDNLIHDNIYVEAWNKGGDHYDFSGMYDELKPYLDRADVAILNQETLVNSAFPASTYPVFSTPTEDGDEVVNIGFNVISMCNNHVLDKGSAGLISSLDYWDSKPVVHYGAYRDEADSENIRTMTSNGVIFAFLGYMEHTNGVFLSDDDPGKVVYLNETEKIKKQIEKARKIADVVVVSCHFGTEVLHPINNQQAELAPKLAEWGADLIIGTQAHCVSKCEYVEGANGRKAFCYYGLGNLFHTMYDKCSAVGILGDLDVTCDFETGNVTFNNIKAIPTISHFEADSYDSMWYNCKVFPLAKYTDAQFARNYNDGVTRDSVMECLSCISDEYLSIE